MLRKRRERFSVKTPIVELLAPEGYKDDTGDDCYYWRCNVNRDFTDQIATDFPEADMVFCEFVVPLKGDKDDIRLLVTDEKNFPMNAPIVSDDGRNFHFATPRGMELQWKLGIEYGDNVPHILSLKRIDRNTYSLINIYRNIDKKKI